MGVYYNEEVSIFLLPQYLSKRTSDEIQKKVSSPTGRGIDDLFG